MNDLSELFRRPQAMKLFAATYRRARRTRLGATITRRILFYKLDDETIISNEHITMECLGHSIF